MSLTADQRDLFDALGRVPGGTFTPDQLRGCVARGFQAVCQLGGVPVPDADDVLAELDLVDGRHAPLRVTRPAGGPSWRAKADGRYAVSDELRSASEGDKTASA